MNDMFSELQDVILRVTDLEPGYYKDEDGALFIVTRYTDETNRIFIWKDNEMIMEKGDILLEKVWIKSLEQNYENDEGVVIEKVELNE